MKRYFDGIKFGMVLQLAIGPMCLIVFNTAKNFGFLKSFMLVFVIASVDALYISLSCFGVSKIFKNEKILYSFKTIGAFALFLLGFNMICSSLGKPLIPSLGITSSSKNLIVQCLVLALSNPITIIYWSTVLTSKLLEEKFSKKQLLTFCFGLISATIMFLTFVSVIGTLIGTFLPDIVSNILNILVGLLIIYFGIRLLLKEEKH